MMMAKLVRRVERGVSFVFILCLLVIFGTGLWWLAAPSPAPSGDAEFRQRVAELVLHARAMVGKDLSEGFHVHQSWSPDWMGKIKIVPNYLVDNGTISPEGKIMIHGTALTASAVITLTPSVQSGSPLEWTCRGEPMKYMPSFCRGGLM